VCKRDHDGASVSLLMLLLFAPTVGLTRRREGSSETRLLMTVIFQASYLRLLLDDVLLSYSWISINLTLRTDASPFTPVSLDKLIRPSLNEESRGEGCLHWQGAVESNSHVRLSHYADLRAAQLSPLSLLFYGIRWAYLSKVSSRPHQPSSRRCKFLTPVPLDKLIRPSLNEER